MMMVVVMVPATRESTYVVRAITARAHILHAFIALLLGIVDMEVKVVVMCHIIRNLVVGAVGATGLAIPSQVLCSGGSGALANGRRVGREARVATLGTRCGVPVFTARVTAPSAPLATRTLGIFFTMGSFWCHHSRVTRGGGTERSTAPSECDVGSSEKVIKSLRTTISARIQVL